MTAKIMKICLTLLLCILAVSAFLGVLALFFYGLILLLVALVMAFLASPENAKKGFQFVSDNINGWLDRLEALWTRIRKDIDLWGEREMAKHQAAELSEKPEKNESSNG